MMNLYQRELYHSWIGDKWKKHKYIDRIKLPGGGYRYIYPEDLKKKALDTLKFGVVGSYLKSKLSKKDSDEYYNTPAKKDSDEYYNTPAKKAIRKRDLDTSELRKERLDTEKRKRTERSHRISKVRTKTRNARYEHAEKEIKTATNNDYLDNPGGERKFKYVGKVKMANGKYRYFYTEDALEAYYMNNGNPTEKELIDECGIKHSSSDEENDMVEINEKRPEHKEMGLSANCFSCTLAYDLRRRGFDVESIPADGARVRDYSSSYKLKDEDFHSNDAILDAWDKKVAEGAEYNIEDIGKETSDNMINDMKKYGEGSRGALNVIWRNGGGHALNWEVKDGKVVIRDSQVNKIYTEDNIYDDLMSNVYQGGNLLGNGTQGPIWFRTDDKELTDEVKKYIASNGGK